MMQGPDTETVVETLGDFTRAQVKALALDVRARMAALPPGGVFPETLCRHVWDEYCWNLQEGPSDGAEWFGGRSFGSVAEALDELALTFVEAACAGLPEMERRILAAAHDVAAFPTRRRRLDDDPTEWDDAEGYAALAEEEQEPEDDDAESLQNYLADLVMEQVSSLASGRSLALIGPDRGSELAMEVSWGRDWIPEALDDLRYDLMERHADALIDADGDISDLVDETVGHLWLSLYAGAEADPVLSDFMASHENDLREIIERSVRGTVQDMRGEVAWHLDREG